MNDCFRFVVALLSVVCICSCNLESPQTISEPKKPLVTTKDSPCINQQQGIYNDSAFIDSLTPISSIAVIQHTPEEVVAFAKTLIGVPYLYGSTDPSLGFDCSGFITYVFHHFKIDVPRSSIDFTHLGKEINIPEAVTGDLILFTGTDSLEKFVGHMGIITDNTDSLRFIHSTSGKKNAVTITALNEYYLQRFVKVIRIF